MNEIVRTRVLSMLPFIVAGIGGVSIIMADAMYVSAILLVSAFGQNIAAALVSNARNRNSTSYHIVAAVLSNGVWFLTFAILVSGNMTWNLFIPFVVGTTLGSLFGKKISLWIEDTLGLTADATKDVKGNELSWQGQIQWIKDIVIKGYIRRLTEITASEQLRSLLLLAILFLIGGISLVYALTEGVFVSVLFLMGIAYAQNISFTLGSRAKNRDSHNFVIMTTVLSSVVWFLTFQHLIENEMSLLLLIPYTVATVFGSVTGGWVSIHIERWFGFRPDENKGIIVEFENIWTFLREWWLLIMVILVGFIYMFLQISPYGDAIIIENPKISLSSLLFVLVLFVGETVFYTIASRAGNRNHVNYHLCARVLNGTVWFITYGCIITLDMSFELLVPIIIGRTVGGVFGQKIGGYFEGRLHAVMDNKKIA